MTYGTMYASKWHHMTYVSTYASKWHHMTYVIMDMFSGATQR